MLAWVKTHNSVVFGAKYGVDMLKSEWVGAVTCEELKL